MTRCGSRVGQNAMMHNTAFRRRGKVCDPRMQGMPMRRREFITLLGGMATAWPLGARAQRPRKFPFVGVLVSASPPHPFADAFWRGLHALGYSDGENIKVEFRYTDLRNDRAKEYAEELVRLSPDVIVAHYAQAVSATMAATRTIPIVMAPHGAPLQLGVIDSLARPGGNVTGLSGMDAEIGGKRVELLRELIPKLRCIAVLAATTTTTPYTGPFVDWKSTRLNSSHLVISYAVFCLKKKTKISSDTVISRRRPDYPYARKLRRRMRRLVRSRVLTVQRDIFFCSPPPPLPLPFPYTTLSR